MLDAFEKDRHRICLAGRPACLGAARADVAAMREDGVKDAVFALLRRKALADFYLGRTVEIAVDRPVGYVHRKEKYTLTYPLN